MIVVKSRIKVKKFDLDYAGQWKIGKSTTKGIQKLEMAVQNHNT